MPMLKIQTNITLADESKKALAALASSTGSRDTG